VNLSRAILAFLVISFIGQIIYYYPNLPEILASHFNAQGEQDGWMTKNHFLIFEVILLLLIIAAFTVLPQKIKKMPIKLINLPNKEHWLSDAKRGETFSIIQIYFEWFGIGLLGLFITINELIFRANLTKQNLSMAVWIPLVFFLIFVGIWLTKFILHFNKPL
jgi:uncharacterized membrane protein